MPVEVLVMCPACGQPQAPRPRCEHCGGTLPPAPVPPQGTNAASPNAAQGVVRPRELRLPDGRTVTIDDRGLSVSSVGDRGSPGAPSRPTEPPQGNAIGHGVPTRIELATLTGVRLELPRVWALLAPIAIALVAVALVPTWIARALLVVLLAASLWLFLRVRSFVVRFERREGDVRLVLGTGAPGSPRGVAAQTAWTELANELRARGVKVTAR